MSDLLTYCWVLDALSAAAPARVEAPASRSTPDASALGQEPAGATNHCHVHPAGSTSPVARSVPRAPSTAAAEPIEEPVGATSLPPGHRPPTGTTFDFPAGEMEGPYSARFPSSAIGETTRRAPVGREAES